MFEKAIPNPCMLHSTFGGSLIPGKKSAPAMLLATVFQYFVRKDLRTVSECTWNKLLFI